MLPREGQEVVDGHTVHAGSTPVGLHLLPGAAQPFRAITRPIRSSCKDGCVSPRRITALPDGLVAECAFPTAPPCLVMFWPSAPHPERV